MKKRISVKKLLLYMVIAVYVAFVLFPYYWVFVTSIKPNNELMVAPPSFWPSNPTFSHYVDLMNGTNFWLYYKNSFIVTVLVVIVSMFISVLASYSLTRLKYRGRNAISACVIFSYLVPASILAIPLYVIVHAMGLKDNLLSLVVVYPTTIVPFCIWMLMGYFPTIPQGLEEAARIDGATRLQALFKIILPLAAPGLAATTIFAFILSWNIFIYPLIFLSKEVNQVLPVGISRFIIGDIYMWGKLMASAVLMTFPVTMLFIIVQRHIASGLTAGAVKG